MTDGYQANKYQFDWLGTPSISTELLNGKIALGLGVTFSVTNYQDDTVRLESDPSKNISTTFATFNNVNFTATFDQISKVLKTVKLDYKMELSYYDAFYDSMQYDAMWDVFKNSIQAKTMYNQIVAEFSFAKDITLGLGFIVRNYFGDQEDTFLNKINPNQIDKLSDFKAGTYGENLKQRYNLTNSSGNNLSSKEQLKKLYYEKRVDYYNFGWAIQFKYKIPVDWLQFPILFVNLGLGWDPFDDDGSTTQNWYKDKDSNHADSWKKNNSDWTSERSVFTIGLVWDF